MTEGGCGLEEELRLGVPWSDRAPPGEEGSSRDPVHTQPGLCRGSECSWVGSPFCLPVDFQRKTLPPLPREENEREVSGNRNRL